MRGSHHFPPCCRGFRGEWRGRGGGRRGRGLGGGPGRDAADGAAVGRAARTRRLPVRDPYLNTRQARRVHPADAVC